MTTEELTRMVCDNCKKYLRIKCDSNTCEFAKSIVFTIEDTVLTPFKENEEYLQLVIKSKQRELSEKL